MNIYESGANKRKRIRRRRIVGEKKAKAGGNKGKERKGKKDKHRRNGITATRASDFTISGNDKKKGVSFIRTKQTVEKPSAKKNES